MYVVLCILCWLEFMYDCLIDSSSTLSVLLLFKDHLAALVLSAFLHKLPPYLLE